MTMITFFGLSSETWEWKWKRQSLWF